MTVSSSPSPSKNKRSRLRSLFAGAIAILLLAVVVPPLVFHNSRPPAWASARSAPYAVDADTVKLLADRTGIDPATNRAVRRQVIFDQILTMIHRADRFLVVDYFLWNDWKGSSTDEFRHLSSELTTALLAKKKALPDLPIVVITDPINRAYGNGAPEDFRALAAAGIPVVFTDLSRLPESNLAYAPYYRFFARFAPSPTPADPGFLDRPRLPNPFQNGATPLSLRQYARLLLFKANHRKVIVEQSAAYGTDLLVGSLNPADSSANHSNFALEARGAVGLAALKSELALAEWSAQNPDCLVESKSGTLSAVIASIRELAAFQSAPQADAEPSARVTWLTEGQIRAAILKQLRGATSGDEVRVALFYLSDRDVVKALTGAAKRGADVRLLLDPNRDAFGRTKNGIPNRPVAAELLAGAPPGHLRIRWADTHGEQFHPKTLCIRNRNTGKALVIAGSANWTRRNLADLNLEADLMAENAPPLANAFAVWFDQCWSNQGGLHVSTDYDAYADHGFSGRVKAWIYRFQEWSGLSTF